MTTDLALAAALLVGYAVGCTPIANAVARRHGIEDLRATGDRNPGYWNARERIGRREALPILLLDAAKGAAGAAFGLAVGGIWGGVLGWLGAILGHMFPAPLRFRGGRSVLCLVGGAIVLTPLACVIAGLALLVIRWRWDFARGAQAGLIVAPFATWVIYGADVELFAMVALLVLVGVRSALADRALRQAGIDKRHRD